MKETSFSILGDSISTFAGMIPDYDAVFFPREGYDVNSVDQMWWSIFAEKMGWKLDTNQSYSGSRVSFSTSYSDGGKGPARPLWSCCQSEKRLGELGTPDVLLIFAGTNDFGQFSPCTLEEFSSAYDNMLKKVKKRLPEARIICFVPLNRLDFVMEQENATHWSKLDLDQAVRNACDGNGVDYVDLAKEIPISAEAGILADSVHPTVLGMKLIADVAIKRVGEILA